MADYCKQCSEHIFGEDFRELAGITKPESWTQGKAAVVICEGCGTVQVDPEGYCVSCAAPGGCIQEYCQHDYPHKDSPEFKLFAEGEKEGADGRQDSQ